MIFSCCRNFLSDITNIGNNQYTLCRNIQHKVSIKIRNRSHGIIAFYDNTGSYDRLAGRILHLTRHFCWAKAVNEKLNRVSNKTNVSFYIKFKVRHTFTAGMNEEDVFFSP